MCVPSDEGGVVYSLVEALHMPYCQLLVQFGSFEQQLLVEKLKEMKLVSGHKARRRRRRVLSGSQELLVLRSCCSH